MQARKEVTIDSANIPKMYPELRKKLVNYRLSNPKERLELLNLCQNVLQNLPSEITPNNAPDIYYELTSAATLIKYANIIYQIEHQGYFNILADFWKMPMENDFAELKKYFEFGKKPTMRLKCPIDKIPEGIWQLFLDCQKKFVADNKAKMGWMKLTIDLSKDNPDALYPLPIQFLGSYPVNFAVDRVYVNSKGQFRLALREGKYLLPGGGMINLAEGTKVANFFEKVINEFLEEEQPNLYKVAAKEYQELSDEQFNRALEEAYALVERKLDNDETLKKATNKDMLTALITRLRKIEIAPGLPKASNLAALIAIVDEFKTSEDFTKTASNIDKLAINVLRAELQVEPYKHTSKYTALFNHLVDNTKVMDHEQFLDDRQHAGANISHTIIITGEPLEEVFRKLHNQEKLESELGDDLEGSEIKHLTLFEALSKFTNVAYSHILPLLTAFGEAAQSNLLRKEVVCDQPGFEAARKVITQQLDRTIKQNEPLIYPKSYTFMTATFDNDLDKVKALLEDYTKKDSLGLRLLSLHWNRHYVKEVNEVVKQIESNEIKTATQALNELLKIQEKFQDDYNPKGSLAKRINFIKDTFQNKDDLRSEVEFNIIKTPL